jgi:hypothetical protein
MFTVTHVPCGMVVGGPAGTLLDGRSVVTATTARTATSAAATTIAPTLRFLFFRS